MTPGILGFSGVTSDYVENDCIFILSVSSFVMVNGRGLWK